MISKIKMLIISAVTALTFGASIAVPAAVMAVSPDPQKAICQGAQDLQINPVTGDPCAAGKDATGFNTALEKIINIISIIVGVVAVIMIIYGGFRYIVSGGTAEKVTSAKNTILYGLIGLIIVALAQVIVRFVLKETSTAVK